jgi:hypothetical protein
VQDGPIEAAHLRELGIGVLTAGPGSPPNPPSPRRKSDMRFVNRGWPLSVSALTSRMASAALPLSKMSATRARPRSFASGGSGRCSSTSCSPWSISARLNSMPGTLKIAAAAPARTTVGKLGSTLRFFS